MVVGGSPTVLLRAAASAAAVTSTGAWHPWPAALAPIACAQALGDIAAARGPKEVDRWLGAELVGGLVPGLDPELQQKPLVDCLLDLLAGWAREFAEAARAAGKKGGAGAGHRRGSRGSGEDLEARGALGAAVVEALARLVRGHLRWQAREEAEGRELAMEDVEVVKVGGRGWQGRGRWLGAGRRTSVGSC